MLEAKIGLSLVEQKKDFSKRKSCICIHINEYTHEKCFD